MNRKPNTSSGCNGVELIFMGGKIIPLVFLNSGKLIESGLAVGREGGKGTCRCRARRNREVQSGMWSAVGQRNPTGGTPTEFRCEGATGWAGRPPMKFKELAGIEKSHCWARGWVWGRWGTGVCVGVSWGECQGILGRIGRMSGFLVGYFRFGKSGSGSLGCPNFVVQNT